jgi:hypothetical protein
MSKKFLLSAATVAIIASTATAGTVKGTNDINVSSEWLQQEYIKNSGNVDINVSGGFIYTPEKIKLTSLKNPVLNVKFTNVKDIAVNIPPKKKLLVCEVNSTNPNNFKTIGDQPVLIYNANDGVSGFTLTAATADTYMTNGRHYALMLADTNCSDAELAIKDPNLFTIKPTSKDVTNISEELTLGTGDTQQVQDSASDTATVSIMPQVCASVTGFSKKIDPTTGFVAFAPLVGTCGATNTTAKQDSITVTYTDVNPITANYQLTTADVIDTINSSISIPVAKVYVNNVDVTNNSDVFKKDNNSFTFVNKNYNFPTVKGTATNVTYTFEVNGKDPIKPVDFKLTSKIDLNQDGTPDITKLNEANAGSWVYNGTTLTTPYIAVNASTQSILRIVNDSNVNANVYWTCNDDFGNVVTNITVKAYDENTTGVVKGGASNWLASDILKAAQTVNPDFAPNGKMSCRALVTSTSGVSGLEIMTINGGRDRVIPFGN